MKKILFLLVLIVSFASCKKETIEPEPSPINTTVTTTTTSTAPTSFFVGYSLSSSASLVDYPDVTINGTTLSYVAENYNTINVNDGVIDRAFEYSIPSGLVSCNDSIDYTVTFNDADIVGMSIFDVQVFSSMDGSNVQCMNDPWGGWQTWEEPTSVPYQVIKTDKIKFICN